MFHAFRKIMLLLGLVILAAGGWLIHQSGLVQDAWWICANTRDKTEKLPALVSGQATSVISGNEFYLQLTNGMIFRMTLSGLKKPRPMKGLMPENDPARLLLDRLIGRQTVTIHRGWFAPNHHGTGFVEVGGTNVAMALVAARLGTLDRDQIRPLPFTQQFALLRAERGARP